MEKISEMERFIRQDAEFQRLYNCSFYNVSDIPREQRINVPMGALIFSVALTEEVCFKFVLWISRFAFVGIKNTCISATARGEGGRSSMLKLY